MECDEVPCHLHPDEVQKRLQYYLRRRSAKTDKVLLTASLLAFCTIDVVHGSYSGARLFSSIFSVYCFVNFIFACFGVRIILAVERSKVTQFVASKLKIFGPQSVSWMRVEKTKTSRLFEGLVDSFILALIFFAILDISRPLVPAVLPIATVIITLVLVGNVIKRCFSVVRKFENSIESESEGHPETEVPLPEKSPLACGIAKERNASSSETEEILNQEKIESYEQGDLHIEEQGQFEYNSNVGNKGVIPRGQNGENQLRIHTHEENLKAVEMKQYDEESRETDADEKSRETDADEESLETDADEDLSRTNVLESHDLNKQSQEKENYPEIMRERVIKAMKKVLDELQTKLAGNGQENVASDQNLDKHPAIIEGNVGRNIHWGCREECNQHDPHFRGTKLGHYDVNESMLLNTREPPTKYEIGDEYPRILEADEAQKEHTSTSEEEEVSTSEEEEFTSEEEEVSTSEEEEEVSTSEEEEFTSDGKVQRPYPESTEGYEAHKEHPATTEDGAHKEHLATMEQEEPLKEHSVPTEKDKANKEHPETTEEDKAHKKHPATTKGDLQIPYPEVTENDEAHKEHSTTTESEVQRPYPEITENDEARKENPATAEGEARRPYPEVTEGDEAHKEYPETREEDEANEEHSTTTKKVEVDKEHSAATEGEVQRPYPEATENDEADEEHLTTAESEVQRLHLEISEGDEAHKGHPAIAGGELRSPFPKITERDEAQEKRLVTTESEVQRAYPGASEGEDEAQKKCTSTVKDGVQRLLPENSEDNTSSPRLEDLQTIERDGLDAKGPQGQDEIIQKIYAEITTVLQVKHLSASTHNERMKRPRNESLNRYPALQEEEEEEEEEDKTHRDMKASANEVPCRNDGSADAIYFYRCYQQFKDHDKIRKNDSCTEDAVLEEHAKTAEFGAEHQSKSVRSDKIKETSGERVDNHLTPRKRDLMNGEILTKYGEESSPTGTRESTLEDRASTNENEQPEKDELTKNHKCFPSNENVAHTRIPVEISAGNHDELHRSSEGERTKVNGDRDMTKGNELNAEEPQNGDQIVDECQKVSNENDQVEKPSGESPNEYPAVAEDGTTLDGDHGEPREESAIDETNEDSRRVMDFSAAREKESLETMKGEEETPDRQKSLEKIHIVYVTGPDNSTEKKESCSAQAESFDPTKKSIADKESMVETEIPCLRHREESDRKYIEKEHLTVKEHQGTFDNVASNQTCRTASDDQSRVFEPEENTSFSSDKHVQVDSNSSLPTRDKIVEGEFGEDEKTNSKESKPAASMASLDAKPSQSKPAASMAGLEAKPRQSKPAASMAGLEAKSSQSKPAASMAGSDAEPSQSKPYASIAGLDAKPSQSKSAASMAGLDVKPSQSMPAASMAGLDAKPAASAGLNTKRSRSKPAEKANSRNLQKPMKSVEGSAKKWRFKRRAQSVPTDHEARNLKRRNHAGESSPFKLKEADFEFESQLQAGSSMLLELRSVLMVNELEHTRSLERELVLRKY